MMASPGSAFGTDPKQGATINYDHAHKLLLRLNETRKHPSLCDATVSIGSASIPVQKSVLSAASDYFRALFDYDERLSCNNGAEKTKNSQSTVSLDSFAISEEIFQAVLDYIYTAQVVLTSDNIQDMLQAADQLLMGDLKNMCCEYLDSCISAHNCIGIFDFTLKLSCSWSHHKVSSYLDKNFSEVSHSEEFLNLAADRVEEFLSRRTIQMKQEDEVLDTVLRWYQYDSDRRKKEAIDLIKKVVYAKQITEEAMGKVKDLPQIGNDCCQAIQELRKNQNNLSYIHRGFTRVFIACGGDESSSSNSKEESHITNKVHCVRTERTSTYPYSDWVQLASMLTPRSGHGLVEVGGCLYVAGGRDSSCFILNSCEKYDPSTNTWKMIAPMSHGRVGFGLVAIENCIYALGGSNDITDPLTSVEVYDVFTNKWSPLPDMLMKRAWATYVAAGKQIYVLGGGIVEKFYESVEVFDTRTQTWSAISPMRERRCDAVAVSVRNDIYVFGGFRRFECPSAAHSGHNLKLCGTEHYSERSDFWVPIQSRHGSPGLCIMGEHSSLYSALCEQDEILVVGELVMNGQIQTIRSYNRHTNTWECVVVNPPPHHTHFPCCALSLPSQLLYQLLWDQDKLRYSDLFNKNRDIENQE